MSPVPASTRVLAGTLRFAGAIGPGATALSTARLTPVTPAIGRPSLAKIPLTWSGVHSGWAWSITATAPETIGAAIEVPPARMYAPPMTHAGHSVEKALPVASGATIRAPGARTSGFA